MRLRSLLLVAVAAVAVATLPLSSGRAFAGISAAGTSVLRVQNLDAFQTANASVDFYRQGGSLVDTLLLPPILPEHTATLNMDQTTLPLGAFAAIVNSDRAVATSSRLRWPASGGAVTAGSGQASTEVLVPFIARDLDSHSSLVSIQNTDPLAQAYVNVEVTAAGGASPQVTQSYSLPAGTGITLDVQQDLEFASLGNMFAGSARISSATPIVVWSFVDVGASQKAVYAFAGLPSVDAKDQLLAPIVASGAPVDSGDPSSPSLKTRVAVQNAGAMPADVTLTYHGTSGTCSGQTFVGATTSIPALAMHVFAQDDAASSNLPAGCRGWTSIASVGAPVVAITVLDVDGDALAGAYAAGAADAGSLRLLLPDAERAVDGVSSEIVVLNAGTGAAQVDLALGDGTDAPLADCGASCHATVPAGATHVFRLLDLTGVPDGSHGAVAVHSDQPVHALAVDVPAAGSPWDLTALMAAADAGGGAVGWVPLAMKGSSSPPPTSVATATLPGTATPTPFGPPGTATPTALGPTDTPMPTATPLMGTATPTPPASPTPIGPPVTPTATSVASATPPPTATSAGATSTPAPLPTATPSSTGPGAPAVDPRVANRVPAQVVAAALADPSRVQGWGMTRNPGVPYHPLYNPYRTCLTLRNVAVPYHPLFNPLIFSAGCSG